jgi:hypothetical protein
VNAADGVKIAAGRGGKSACRLEFFRYLGAVKRLFAKAGFGYEPRRKMPGPIKRFADAED